jgi:hypothetical protein
MMYPTTVVGFVAPDGASATIDGADGRQVRLYLCCRCSGLKLALLGPCDRAFSWAALWGKADVP